MAGPFDVIGASLYEGRVRKEAARLRAWSGGDTEQCEAVRLHYDCVNSLPPPYPRCALPQAFALLRCARAHYPAADRVAAGQMKR
jgi:hypothetical protein